MVFVSECRHFVEYVDFLLLLRTLADGLDWINA